MNAFTHVVTNDLGEILGTDIEYPAEYFEEDFYARNDDAGYSDFQCADCTANRPCPETCHGEDCCDYCPKYTPKGITR